MKHFSISNEQIIKYIKTLDFQNIQEQGQDSHAAYFEAFDGNTKFELKYVYETDTLYCREKDLEDWHLLA